MSANAQQPTYEELLALVEVQREQLRVKQEKIEAQSGRLKQQQGEIAQLTEDKKVLTFAFATTKKELLKLGVDLQTLLGSEYVINDQCEVQLVKCHDKAIEQVPNNRFLRTLVRKGNESLKPTAKEVEETEQIAQLMQQNQMQMHNIKSGLRRALNSSVTVLKNLQSQNECMDAAKALAELCDQDSKNLPQPEAMVRLLKGRQLSKATLLQKHNVATQKQLHCECGAEVIDLAVHGEECKALSMKLQDMLEEIHIGIELSQCPRCGKVHAQMAQDAPVPVLPNQTVSQATLINMAHLLHNSVPMHRCEKLFLEPMRLGKDTLLQLRNQWVKLYLNPLMQAMMDAIGSPEVLISDETTYDCLQSQGKGVAKKVEKPAKQSYVLALANPDDSPRRFMSYRYMRSRSAECIKEVIKEMKLNPQVLVTDGYAAYRTVIAQQLPEAGHQSCLIHFRREVCEAINWEKLGRECEALSDNELEVFMQNADQTQKMLLTVLQGLRLVMHFENEAQRKEQENQPDLLARRAKLRREKVKPLMDGIDKVMTALAGEYTIIKGTRYQKSKESPYAGVAVYYMNQRDALRYFLTDVRVPCDTNYVERAIRPLTLIRKNAEFSQSIEGMESLCAIYSVFETAKVNGIEDPVKWLQDYGRALFKHCYERNWERELLDGKNPQKKIMSWDFEGPVESFDFSKWLPWNYDR